MSLAQHGCSAEVCGAYGTVSPQVSPLVPLSNSPCMAFNMRFNSGHRYLANALCRYPASPEVLQQMDALCGQLMSVMRSPQPLSGASCSTCCLLLTYQTCGAVLLVSGGECLCWVLEKTFLAPCRVFEEICQLSADPCDQKGSSTESAADAVSSAGHSPG